MIFCAQPYLKSCFMCPFYILSTCPSKGLCTALTHTHTHTHTLSLSHHSPLCKSYSPILSFGRKTSRSATDCKISHRLQRNTLLHHFTHKTAHICQTAHFITLSQSVQFGASERVSRVNWFSSGLQSAFRESIGSVRGFRARFASQSVQFGASERVSRVNWFSSGLQSAFRESIGGFRARFASQSVQFGASERVSRVI